MPMLATETTPIVASRLVRLAFKEPKGAKAKNHRREQVAAYVEEWLEGRIVSELYGPSRCYLVVAFCRPVSLTAARAFAKGCPHSVRGSCSLIGE